MFTTEFTWEITYISPIELIWQNQLEKVTIVIKEISDKEYAKSIQFDLLKDKVKLADKLSVGETITAHLNFKSNYSEKTGKYYQSISAWRVDKSESTSYESTDDDMPF